MIAAYAITGVVLAVYIASLWRRGSAALRD